MRLKGTCLKTLVVLWKQANPYCVQNMAYWSAEERLRDLLSHEAEQCPPAAQVRITTLNCKPKDSCKERTDCQSMGNSSCVRKVIQKEMAAMRSATHWQCRYLDL